MKKSCKYCGGVHPFGFECPKKPIRKKIPTKQSNIRSTSRWTKKSIEIKERDHYLCRICLEHGIINYNKLETHHIIPLEENSYMAFEDDWLITLCKEHHEQAEIGKIGREYLHYLATHEVEGIPPAIPSAVFEK